MSLKKPDDIHQVHSFFSHPDYTVGTRIALVQPQNAGHGLTGNLLTVGRDFHPAPKNFFHIQLTFYLNELLTNVNVNIP